MMMLRSEKQGGRGGGRGFSLVEVMLAVFILAIGLIMVAGVFPVGAEWTRQDWEDSMGQMIGRNAVAIIQTKYTRADLIKSDGTSYVGPSLQALPLFAQRLPLAERAYCMGQAQPFPAAASTTPQATAAVNAQAAPYFWTALIRELPSLTTDGAIPAKLVPLTQAKYELFIFVMRKGGSGQIFTADLAASPSPWALGSGSTANWVEIPAATDRLNNVGGGTRVTRTSGGVAADGTSTTTLGVPYLAAMNAATFGSWGASGTNLLPTGASFSTAGWIVVGQYSGTVSRMVTFANSSGTYTTTWRPPLSAQDTNVIFAAPADGTTLSPLVYVYQTTVEF